MSERILRTIVKSIEVLTGKVDSVTTKMGDLQQQTDLIATHVVHMDERLETCATKKELHEMENRLLTSMDRIVKRHNDFDIELTVLRGGHMDHGARLTTIESALDLPAAT